MCMYLLSSFSRHSSYIGMLAIINKNKQNMNYIKLLLLIFISIIISCTSDSKQKLLEKENELLKKELELSKKENEFSSKSNFADKTLKNNQESTKINYKPVEEFLPSGYKIVPTDKGKNIVLGKLNNDELQDAVVLIAQSNNQIEEAEEVRIAILTGIDNGEYVVSSISGNLTSAFIYNNLSKPQIKVKKRVISAIHQSMRHDYELKFRYEKGTEQFMLIGSELNNYGNAMNEGAGNISSNFLAKKRIINLHGESEKTISLNNLLPLSMINDENVYDIIGSE